MQSYFYSIFFSPITNIVFISSIILITLSLITYFCINQTIVSIVNFELHSTPSSIINLLKNPSNYKYWWNKFKKNTVFTNDFNYISDDSLLNTQVTLKIFSSYSHEIWYIIIKQESPQKLNITIIQDTFIYSKIRKVFTSFFNNRETSCFKNSLIKELNP